MFGVNFSHHPPLAFFLLPVLWHWLAPAKIVSYRSRMAWIFSVLLLSLELIIYFLESRNKNNFTFLCRLWESQWKPEVRPAVETSCYQDPSLQTYSLPKPAIAMFWVLMWEEGNHLLVSAVAGIHQFPSHHLWIDCPSSAQYCTQLHFCKRTS